MRYFRELKLSTILWTNALLGFFSGYFLYQAVRLALGLFKRGLFWHILGVQYFCFVLLVVYFIDKTIWQKKRFHAAHTPDDKRIENTRLALTAVVYFAAAAAAAGLYVLILRLAG